MEIHKSKDCDLAVKASQDIYQGIINFAQNQFHLKHGKLCNIKPKQRKRKH